MQGRWLGALCMLAVVAIGVGAAASAPPLVVRFDMEYADEGAARAAGWTFPDVKVANLWRLVDQSALDGVLGLTPFPSPTRAAYFGIPVPATRTGSYHTGARVTGHLDSPALPTTVAAPGAHIRVVFRHWRQVESYAGKYDVTVAYAVFQRDGQFWNPVTEAWQAAFDGYPILWADSSDPSVADWLTVESAHIRVPSGTQTASLRFVFDSVDGAHNNFLGWLIDDVAVHRVPAPLRIVTTELPTAVVDVSYGFTLVEAGGTPPYSWSVIEGRLPQERLPRGLAFDRDTGMIFGIPRDTGVFSVTFRLEDNAGARVERELSLRVHDRPGVVVYERVLTAVTPVPPWTISHPDATVRWHHVPAQGMYFALTVGDFPRTYNDPGRRTFGQLTTGEIAVTLHREQRLRIMFEHQREVERHAAAAYDKTDVQVRFDGGAWTTIWSRDSRHPSTWGVRLWEEALIAVPATAANMQLRFVFDSVDGVANTYRGWLLRHVRVEEIKEVLAITTTDLPVGTVGVAYSATLTAQGGTPPYTWDWEGDRALPPGLSLNRGTGAITGIPTAAGTFSIVVRVTDALEARAERSLRIEIAAVPETLFFEDFGHLPNEFLAGARWQPVALPWQVVDNVLFAGTNIAHGRGFVAHFDLAPDARRRETLTSKPFSLAGAEFVRITFDSWRQVEFYAGAFDQTFVEVQFGTGPWQRVWYRDATTVSEQEWVPVALGTAAGGGFATGGAATMRIRFVFDSVDQFNNAFVGWLVDNIRVTRTATGGPLVPVAVLAAPSRAHAISVFNYPNPIRDVHTTTFAVRGVEAEAMRVEIFDLTGRLVYRAEGPGNELVWHTQDLTGLPLANGVYLYKVYVRVGGVWVTTQVQRLVILR